MARRKSEVEEAFAEYAEELGWSRAKQVEQLLKFIDSQDLEDTLLSYLDEQIEERDEEDDEDASSEDDY